MQQKLLSVLFDLLVDNPSPLVAVTIGSVFKRVSVAGYGSLIFKVILSFKHKKSKGLKSVNKPAS